MQMTVEQTELEEKCAEFGKVLGLDGSVSVEVLLAATEDQTYAHNLLATRKQPAFLNHLLANPPQMVSPVIESEPAPQEHSNMALIGKATQALIKWSGTGFAAVDQIVLETRENACLACPNLIDPQKILQRLTISNKASDVVGQRIGNKICNLCGCNASRKIRVPTESCPGTHPTQPGLTRWGDPKML